MRHVLQGRFTAMIVGGEIDEDGDTSEEVPQRHVQNVEGVSRSRQC